MQWLTSLFTVRSVSRMLNIGGAIVGVYLSAALGLIYWPGPEPFADVGPLPVTEATTAEQGGEVTSLTLRDGTELTVQRTPGASDTTVVLLHGVAADRAQLAGAARQLHQVTGATVLVPDLRGHGDSGGAPFDVAYIGQYEHDLADVLTQLRADQPGGRLVVAGHSMGGGVALRHALLDDVVPPDAYLLLAPNFGEGPTQRTPEGDQEPSAYVHFDFPRMIGQLMLTSVGVSWFDGLPILTFNDPHEVKAYSFRAVMSAQPTRPQTADVALAAIDAPMLVVVGQDDEVFDAAAYPDFVSAHSDAETVVLPGLDHQGILGAQETWDVVGDWFTSTLGA